MNVSCSAVGFSFSGDTNFSLSSLQPLTFDAKHLVSHLNLDLPTRQ